ncbi:HAD family hydrolase [Paenibacillus radicis (ex Gao et al. 2016)]|uniref:Phosphoglycolate phosphatase n=1 Tax=Paenibacillus radicis (ex Gao et al. 2016) TaxID=1737354 RepID=A0A917HPM0_9BACL|nr:HAD family hydrolase [Paenibacillus radicis (ex Gao et al. 2016)]GGG86678.1 phosphoglycolate phosphatase [Paenibacillus radicis (ex Gao et al. 2016)]
MGKMKTILFDLDGTLTDPKLGITSGVQYALSKFDIHVDNLDTLEPFIGPPLTETFQELYGLSEEQSQQGIAYYREYFADRGMYENELYPGMHELLGGLKERGVSVCMATSKPTFFAEKIADYFDIGRYFDFIGGSNLDNTRTDKAEVIQHVLETQGIDPSETIMIGDRKHDVIGARKNGIPSIAVGYGYGRDEELRLAEPAYRAATVDELAALLRELME